MERNDAVKPTAVTLKKTSSFPLALKAKFYINTFIQAEMIWFN